MAPVQYHLGKFPPTELDWERLIPQLGPANAGLARYDGLLTAIPNAQVLLAPLTTQEAVLSSKIEGTVVTMAEVLEVEAGFQSETLTVPKRQDVEEVLNYRSAMRASVSAMVDRPLSQQMIRSAHALLMRGVRGRDKKPGSFRTIQNWIGQSGCTIENASYIPIGPEYVQIGMDSWEQYLNSTNELDTLVQLAILHVELEAIHPFEDGNGRLGRMLIPLFLYQRKMLSSPDFYISGYLEANGDEYRDRLRNVSRDGDWTSWCEFFLKGIKEQASENEDRARKILDLYNRLKVRSVEITHSQHAIHAVDFLFRTPIFSGPLFTNHSGIPRPTAGRILARLRDEGIVQPLVQGRGRRPGIFAFRQLIDVAEGRTSYPITR